MFLVSFTNDPKDLMFGIDVLDGKTHRFTYAKAAEIHQLKTKTVVGLSDDGNETKKLLEKLGAPIT